MAFKFEIHEPFLKALPRIARERIDRVVESLGEKPHPGAESIHDARKNLKSLRALLRLSRGALGDEVRSRENMTFRDAGRELSAMRDPQALLEALEHFDKRQHHTARRRVTTKQESARRFIEKIRERIKKNLVEEIPSGTVRTLLKELRDARRRVELWFKDVSQKSGDEWDDFVGKGLSRTYRKGKNLVWQFELIGRQNTDDAAWHELRKSAKALGYQLRLLKPIWPEMMNAWLNEIDQLTDRLGDANDLSILRGRVLSEPYDPSEARESGETRRIFLQSLDQRKQKLHLAAFELARLIYVEKPGQFEGRLRRCWEIWRSQIQASESHGANGRENRPAPGDRIVKEETAATPHS